MMRRYNRLLVAVLRRRATRSSRLAAFAFAYLLRFDWLADCRPGDQGLPAVRAVPAHRCRSSCVIVPIAFQVQGLYRLRRGRSRVDDFFAVFVGSILAVVFGVGGTLYFQTYYVPDSAEGRRRSTKCRRSSGRSSSSSTSCSPTRRASSCAKRSSGAGARASGSSAC